MTLNEYQQAAARTDNGDPYQWNRLSLGGLGLAGEAGEVADLIKKHLFHGHPLDPDKVVLELGDVLWYIAQTARVVGRSLDDVAQANLDKLARRYPEGFSYEASRNREV